MSTNIRDFFLHVLPWPGDDLPGFCNVHVQGKINGKTFWTGAPTRNVDQFLQAVYSYRSWPTPPDIYFCLSRQSNVKVQGDKQKAAKSQQNALALKAIWLDVDVKPKAFQTVGDALDAVKEFYTKYKLPLPSAYVASGGGLHVYWISSKELTPQEWQSYAEGLKSLAIEFFGSKIDAGVIADSARVLRVPGTFNYKYDPPKAVKLLGIGGDYDFATSLAMLPTIAPQIIRTNHQSLAGTPASAFSALPVESLGEGIGQDQFPPLDPAEMVRQCGHFREALTTGGKDFSQGLWNLTTLASTFLEDGHALAHRMARGYAGYTYDETEALWERKLAERSSIGLGWPSCSSIQGEGCKHCATCPILARNKSPLNLARIPSKPQRAIQPVATYVAPSQVGTPRVLTPLTDADMPDSSYTVINGIIHKVIEHSVRGEAPDIKQLPLFHCKLYEPWVQAWPDALNFITSADKGSYAEVCIEKKKMTAMELEHALYDARVLPVPENQKYVRSFLVSWLGKLQNAAAAHTNVPFGWHMDGNTCKGFSYGSILYKPDGSRGPVGLIDPKLRAKYGPTGNTEPWWEAYRTIRNQERIGLQVVMASAFGASLMFGAGQYCVLMSVFGDSGANKSSAARVAAAVWGSPKLTKENENATEKSVLQTLGQIKHLPYFWDEIKNEPAQKKAYNVLYMGTGGAEGSRLNSDVTQRDKGDWQTIVGIFSNPCFGNYILKENPNTTAGLMRVFEWEEKEPSKNGPGQISVGDADRIFDKLDRNFGHVGKQYAAFLGANRDLAYNTVAENGRWFEKAVEDTKRNTNAERFWIAFASAVYTGAVFANEHIGTDFNLDEMRTFLVQKILAMRARSREENVQGGSMEHTEDMLTNFLKYEERATCVTKGAPPLKPGTPGIINIDHSPQNGVAVQVQWVNGPNPELRFSKKEFYRWLGQPDVRGDTRAIMEGLKKHYAAVVKRGTLAAGTSLAHGAEPLVFMPVPKNIEDMLPSDDTTGLLSNPDAKNVS
jgi:Domain of unknown function (DUF927)